MLENKDLISEEYSQYYENHQLAASLEVYLPLVKMDLMMDYICKAPISTLEEYICRSIKQGITDRYGIMDALALEDEVVNDLVEQLIQAGIIEEQAGKLIFTKQEYNDAENLKTKQHKKNNVIWCYKGLINADKKIDTHMKSIADVVTIQEVLQHKGVFYLLPNILIDVKQEELKALTSKMFHYPKASKDEVLEILDLEILKSRTVVYDYYKVLFFKGVEGDIKVLVHKADGNQKVDEAFTKTLQRLCDRSELMNQFRYTSEDGQDSLAEINKKIGSMVIAE